MGPAKPEYREYASSYDIPNGERLKLRRLYEAITAKGFKDDETGWSFSDDTP